MFVLPNHILVQTTGGRLICVEPTQAHGSMMLVISWSISGFNFLEQEILIQTGTNSKPNILQPCTLRTTRRMQF
jgi:hypothetical protein